VRDGHLFAAATRELLTPTILPKSRIVLISQTIHDIGRGCITSHRSRRSTETNRRESWTHSGFVSEKSRDGHKENWPLALKILDEALS
jgi:hypothetical protein